MKWEKQKLKDVCELAYGKSLTADSRIPGNYPVYGSAGEVGTHTNYLIDGPGIIIGRKGSVGTVYYEKRNFFPIDTSYYVIPKDGNDLRFLYYKFQTLGLNKLNSDAAVPGLNRNVAYEQSSIYPPLPTQRRIASILSAYDDLIENNLKRIRLLEEKLMIEYSILEEKSKNLKELDFSNFVTFVKGIEPGSSYYLSEKSERTIPFIRVGDLSKRGSDIFIEEEKSKGIICNSEDVLVSMDGTIGIVKYGVFGCYSSGIRKAISNGVLNNAFIFCYLSSKKIQSVIYSHSKGSTIQHAGSSINQFKIKLPEEISLNDFIKFSNPIYDLMNNLLKQNTLLRSARDILLPRLMSGQIEV